jgi:uncharacterized paraquat-inducible protein A
MPWPLHWMWNHPYQTTFYILAIIASIYGSNIKTFLSIPPQTFSIWIAKARWKSTNRRLHNLQKCHNNSYSLILHLSSDILFILLLTFGNTVIAISLLALVGHTISTHKDFDMHYNNNATLAALVMIAGLARAFALITFITDLNHFDKRTSMLRSRLNSLQSKLENVGITMSVKE